MPEADLTLSFLMLSGVRHVSSPPEAVLLLLLLLLLFFSQTSGPALHLLCRPGWL